MTIKSISTSRRLAFKILACSCGVLVTGAAALAHLTTVGALLEEMLKHADITRLEIHGPAADLEIMKPVLAGLNPTWFETACGITR